MKIVILEDNPVYISLLEAALKTIPLENTVVGVATNVAEARSVIQVTQPEVLILDIELKDETSFDLLAGIPYENYQIIFATGHDSYALAAFDVHAIGYLVKPVKSQQLEKLLLLAQANITGNYKRDQARLPALKGNGAAATINVPSGSGFDIVRISAIIRCEAVNNSTYIYLENKKKLVSSYNVGKFWELLMEHGFFHPHRSHIINLNFVKKYFRIGTVLMDDGEEIPVARAKRQAFLAIFSGGEPQNNYSL